MLAWIKDTIKGVKAEDQCVFCKIRDNPTDQSLNRLKAFLYEDQDFYAIHDRFRATAQQHILVITKKHIRTALQIKDKQTLLKMKQIATKVLIDLSSKAQYQRQQKIQINSISQKLTAHQGQKNLRFGFHLPPYNSVDHVHLHGFLLPFDSFKYDKILYGCVMTSVESLLETLQK